MADLVEISLPRTRFDERTNFTLSVNFRTQATSAAAVPTTIHYKIDNITTKMEVIGWTSVSPSAAITLVMDSDVNKIHGDHNRIEKLQVLVMADQGLSTQALGQAVWQVINHHGII